MSGDLRAELARILDALSILGPGAFRLGDGPVVQAPPEAMAAALSGVFYTHCYAHRFPGPQSVPSPRPDPENSARLDAAIRGAERWDGGWRIYAAHPDGSLGIIKGQVQRIAAPGQYLALNGLGTPPRMGEMVAIWMPRSSGAIQAAFHFAFGETPGDQWDDHALTRFYFNVGAEAAPALLEWVTGAMNAFQVPFRMKALVDPALYGRSDAAVLYVARRHAVLAARLLSPEAPRAAVALADPVPLFTCRYAPGIGIAEEPGTGESFGMHRCRLMAEAVLHAWHRGATDGAARIEAVAAHFAGQGLDLDRPWLSAGRSDIYAGLSPEELAA